MHMMRAWARQHPLAMFVVLAYGITWAMLPLAHRYTHFGVLALLGPAVAAVITARCYAGDAPGALWSRVLRWRVPVRWYLIALVLPLPISLLAGVAANHLGATGPIEPVPITMLGMIVFVMVLGEEIGWRGWALPILLESGGPLRASVVVGIIWATWHLPLFYMTGMPQYGSPFGAYVIYTISLSVLLTWLVLRTGGSVVIATLFHGAVNTFIVTSAGATASQRGWGNAIAFGLVAMGVALGALRAGKGSAPRVPD